MGRLLQVLQQHQLPVSFALAFIGHHSQILNNVLSVEICKLANGRGLRWRQLGWLG